MPPRSKIWGILFLSCLSFCPPLWNFNLANNIWTVSARALIFHMNIPCDKTFSWVPLFFILWPWPCSLTKFLKTLTLIKTFEQWVLKLWYFTCVFLVIRPFRGYHYFLHCDLDLGVWPIFKKIFKLANNFWTVSARALIFHMSIACDKTFRWFHYFKINIRAFILHMSLSISCDMIFLLVSRYLSLWPWPSLE